MNSPLPPAPVAPGLTRNDLILHLTPEQRRAFEHERRRRATDIEALHFGVVFPEVVENLMLRAGRA
jgi:hypothetical protein